MASVDYKGRYDLYAKWDKRNVVIEFKYDLVGLFKDFNDERKMFDEIDVAVLWEITERDHQEVTRRGISLVKLTDSQLGGGRMKFPGASSQLVIDAVKPLFIIEMKKVLE